MYTHVHVFLFCFRRSTTTTDAYRIRLNTVRKTNTTIVFVYTHLSRIYSSYILYSYFRTSITKSLDDNSANIIRIYICIQCARLYSSSRPIVFFNRAFNWIIPGFFFPNQLWDGLVDTFFFITYTCIYIFRSRERLPRFVTFVGDFSGKVIPIQKNVSSGNVRLDDFNDCRRSENVFAI